MKELAIKMFRFNHDFSSRFRILKGGKISLVVSAFLAGLSVSAVAAPTGGVVTSGSATISQSGSVTNITQTTGKASINWNNFSIAGNETVNFNQPNVNSITLNRVIGNERSVIDGALNANGQVWILNSNGILFNSTAKINTAGILATTKNISDADFQNGNYKFTGDSSASIINMGTIDVSDSGYVAMLANTVQNDGTIKAYKGTVHLTGANEATINLNGNSIVSLTVDKGVLDALVENKNIIQADGGKVYLTTNAVDELLKGVVNNTGIIEAKSLEDVSSEVILFAHGGTATVSGAIDATGGFVETSGKVFQNKADLSVKASHWLIDPNDITIDATLAGTISTALESGDVTVDTTTSGSAGNGDIFVNSDITKSAGTEQTLTFKAERDIVVASGVDITSTSDKLNTVFWSDSDGNSDGMIYLKNGSSITTNGGDITLSGGADLATGYAIGNAQNANGITLDNVDLLSGGGNIHIRGKSRSGAATTVAYSVGSFGNVDGVRLHGGTTINSGNGIIKIIGESVGTSGSGNGIELSHSISDLITSSSSLSNAIYLEGKGGSSSLNDSWGIYTWRANIQATNGGGIHLKGNGQKNNGITIPVNSSVLANSGKIILEGTGYGTGAKAVEVAGYVGQKSGTSVTTSSSNIEIIGNTFATSGTVQSSGSLTIKAYTSSTTIGLGGATGTLSLASSYFSTNFSDGFSSITIGDATAGTITIGGTTTYYDTLIFKTASDIFTNTSTTLTANGSNSLVFWSDLDNTNAGGITFNSGSSITTNGGHIWMGGGTASGTAWNGLTVGSSYARGTGGAVTGGIDMSSVTIYTSGGNIKMYGYGPSAGGAGIYLKNSTISTQVDSSSTTATGQIELRGDGYYTNSANGMGLYVDNTSIIGGNGGVVIEGHQSVNNLGQWSIPLFFKSTTPTDPINIYALNNGSLDFNLYSNVAGSQTYNNFMQYDTPNVTIGKSGQNSYISIKTYGGSNSGLFMPNVITGGDVTIDLTGASSIGSGTTAGWDTSSPWNTIDIAANQLSIAGTTNIIGNSGITASVRFTNTSNNLGSLSVSDIKNLKIVESDGFTLGDINTIGTIDIATLTGDLTLNGNIATTNTTTSAITLNAGKNSSAGTSTGGNIIHTSGTITTGTNGRVTLYSGDISDSIGLSTLISNGNFRYNSDETTTNYTSSLGSGIYAIYREQPLLSVSPSTTSSTYGSSVNISGVTGTVTGYLNSDNTSTTTGIATFITTATNTSNAGSYNIAYGSGLSNSLGYGFIDNTSVNNEYTINKADATVTANSDTVTYNGQVQSVSGFTVTGLVNNETISVLDGVSGATASGTNAGTYNTALAGTDENYNLTFVDGTLTIAKAPLTLNVTGTTTTYDGTAKSLSSYTTSGLVNSEDSSVLDSVVITATRTNAGTTTSSTVASDNNYVITVNESDLIINKAHLTVTADQASKIYGDINPTLTTALSGFVNGETLATSGVTGAGSASTTATSTTGAGIASITVGVGTLSASNYDFTNLVNGTLTINLRPITITADSVSKTYGEVNPSLTYAVTTGSIVNSDTFTGNLATSATQFSSAGNYDITSTLVNSNYDITFVGTNKLLIAKADATVTANSDTVTYNGQVQSVSGFTVTGLVNNETISVLDGVSGATASGTNAGEYNTNLTGTDENYNLTFVDGSLIIKQPVSQPKVIDSLNVQNYQMPTETFTANIVDTLIQTNFVGENIEIETLASSEIKNEISILPQSVQQVETTGLNEPQNQQAIVEQTTSSSNIPLQENIQLSPKSLAQIENSQEPNIQNRQSNNLVLEEKIQSQTITQNDKIQDNELQTTKEIQVIAQLQPVQTAIMETLVSQDGLKQSIQSYENELQNKGMTTTESQTIVNALLQTSLTNPQNSQIILQTLQKAIAIDKQSPVASLSNGSMSNTNPLFAKALQNLLAKGIEPNEAYKEALKVNDIKIPKEKSSLANEIGKLLPTQAKVTLNLLAKGYSQEEALKIASQMVIPKESQKSDIVSGKMVNQSKQLASFLTKYSLEEALKLSQETKIQEEKFNSIDKKSSLLNFVERSKKGDIPKDSLFDTILSNELKKNSFEVAMRNTLEKYNTLAMDKNTQLNLSKIATIGEFKKNLTNGEKMWWKEFVKQTLSGKTEKEASFLATKSQKFYENKVKLAKNADERILKKGVK